MNKHEWKDGRGKVWKITDMNMYHLKNTMKSLMRLAKYTKRNLIEETGNEYELNDFIDNQYWLMKKELGKRYQEMVET